MEEWDDEMSSWIVHSKRRGEPINNIFICSSNGPKKWAQESSPSIIEEDDDDEPGPLVPARCPYCMGDNDENTDHGVCRKCRQGLELTTCSECKGDIYGSVCARCDFQKCFGCFGEGRLVKETNRCSK